MSRLFIGSGGKHKRRGGGENGVYQGKPPWFAEVWAA
jgi:hypothetical protein